MLLNNLEAPLIYHNNQKDASFEQKAGIFVKCLVFHITKNNNVDN